RCVVICNHSEGAKDAPARCVDGCSHVLERLYDGRLGFDLARIHPYVAAGQYFYRDGVALDVAAATIAGGVFETNPLNAASVIGRDLLLLRGHRIFRMAVHFSEPVGTQRKLVADSLAQRDPLGELDDQLGISPANI